MSVRLRNSPTAGFAADQASRSMISQSSGAEYKWQTIRLSFAFIASSSQMLNRSPSVAACVLIAINSGSSCAPCAVSMASIKASCGPRTWPTSSKIASTGDKPCAVPASAEIALYSTFIGRPISILLDGTTLMIFDSPGDSRTIFSASLNTSDA